MDPKHDNTIESATELLSSKTDDAKKNLIEDMKKKLRIRIKKTEVSPHHRTPEQNKQIEIKIFKENFKPALNANKGSYEVIPKFYFKLPRQGEILSQKLREETRAQFLQRKSKELLDNAELKHLWMLLEKFNTVGANSNEDFFISYPEFKELKEQAGPKYAPYLTAEVYGRLQRAEGGRVRAVSLFNYAMRCVWLQQTRIGLSLYDVTGQGYLREHDLESYIAELVPSLAALEGLDASFTSFYVCTAARKFLFFLDPLRVGRVRIRDLLACSFLDDLLELREEDLPMEQQEMNWFSGASALRVYGQYLNLDRDHNGMLSIDELAGYGSGTLTRVFLERVFQQCLTYEGEMDYKSYLDFVLALENRREPQAIAYIFRVLDLHGQGYLDSFTLNYFYKGIQEQVAAQCGEPVSFADVQDELLDMVRPAARGRLTLPDLLRCGRAHIALSLLIELHGFMAHEHREALAADA